MSLPLAARFDIETLIAIAQPHRIVLLGDVPVDIADDYVAQQALLGIEISVVSIPSDQWRTQLADMPRCDLAIVSGVLETLEKPIGKNLLATLRDQASSQFCVHVTLDDEPSSKTWALTDFLAMALVRVNHYENAAAPSALFKYSISSYKRTPDWLNPDNWANPDLWGKYWW